MLDADAQCRGNAVFLLSPGESGLLRQPLARGAARGCAPESTSLGTLDKAPFFHCLVLTLLLVPTAATPAQPAIPKLAELGG